MPTGTVAYSTFASSSVDTISAYTPFSINTSALVNGTNSIAVEVHQGALTSSDLAFDMSLVATIGAPAAPANSYSDLNMTPGSNATSLNFSWFSTVSQPKSEVQIAKKSDMTGTTFPVAAATSFNGTSVAALTGFFANKVTATGLTASTDYVYRVGDGLDADWSPVYHFSTHDTSNFSFMFVGDPQIGAGGNVATDTAGWVDTMNKATTLFPDFSFLMSAGDQVNSSNDESQYTGYLSPSQLTSLPMATTIGNHDSGDVNYTDHFNNPNVSSTYGITTAGSDYSYTYGNVLFMDLNTNDSNVAEHEQFMMNAIAADPTAKWKIVTWHQSIYSCATHEFDSDIVSLRAAMFPVIDQLHIDMVLSGHDHSYTRSYQMLGGQPQINQTVNSAGDVVNPTGTLYITANSGSGSKYYQLQPNPEPYASVRTQINVPTFSRISVTNSTLTISTYRTDTMAQTDTYTILKTQPTGAEITSSDAVSPVTNTNTVIDSNPSYTVSMNNLANANAFKVSVHFDPTKLSITAGMAQALNNTSIISEQIDNTNGVYTAILGAYTPITSADYTDLIKLYFKPLATTLNNVTVSLITANTVSLDTTNPQYSATDVTGTVNTANASTYIQNTAAASDINVDGTVTLADLSVALAYYRATYTDPTNWVYAKKADINLDGTVTISDFSLIAGFIK